MSKMSRLKKEQFEKEARDRLRKEKGNINEE